ncbi:MAG: hypothetical protein B6D61_08125 [Bacteroidetes bacterium 4484_249]|nr:MAG: hypothetical protein B6D61_08125 [Bacteroidetes bacterium 4484_249]
MDLISAEKFGCETNMDTVLESWKFSRASPTTYLYGLWSINEVIDVFQKVYIYYPYLRKLKFLTSKLSVNSYYQ